MGLAVFLSKRIIDTVSPRVWIWCHQISLAYRRQNSLERNAFYNTCMRKIENCKICSIADRVSALLAVNRKLSHPACIKQEACHCNFSLFSILITTKFTLNANGRGPYKPQNKYKFKKSVTVVCLIGSASIAIKSFKYLLIGVTSFLVYTRRMWQLRSWDAIEQFLNCTFTHTRIIESIPLYAVPCSIWPCLLNGQIGTSITRGRSREE